LQKKHKILEVQNTVLNQEIKKLYAELAHSQQLNAEYLIELEKERIRFRRLAHKAEATATKIQEELSVFVTVLSEGNNEHVATHTNKLCEYVEQLKPSELLQ
jgi:hypothetical protein